MCNHTATQKKEKDTAYYCIECGEKVLEIDHRECQHCRNFKNMGMFEIPICKKKLMGVTRTMHVTYYVKDGSCWE
jgi:predicted RNA-binding Zn-ribbon protein involved in translation (DUF1610 family)